MSAPPPDHHPPPHPPRRRRGAARLSCAECRRLKLRCDRKTPCESCIKRGCSAICPDGSLTTGRGNRFILASTQELHEKISELCNRVRDLEDALRDSHAHLSNQTHPLLTEELLRIKAPLQRETDDRAGIRDQASYDVVDSFGSLSISSNGKIKYYGNTANSWYYLQNELEEDSDDRTYDVEQLLPSDVIAQGSVFPVSPTASPTHHVGDRLGSLASYLPEAHVAVELRELYFQRAAWMYSSISRSQVETEVFAHFYIGGLLQPSPPSDSSTEHRLALIFMVLAIGALMDPNREPYNLDAEKYHRLARAALFNSTIFDEPTLYAVQALFLMSYYLFLADRHGTSDGSRWVIMGFAVKLAQSIGLHRDSTKWGIDADQVKIRREIFWELYTYDSWQCFTFGRPPSFSLCHVDCKFPFESEDSSGEHSFDAWKHRFSAECMSVVHDQAFGAKSPSYQTILQLDRKLRAFPVPPALQVAGFGGSTDMGQSSPYPDTQGLILQRHIVLAIREMNLLYMHRAFFARAISENSKDPLGSPYGTSVIAAYRSAGSLVALVRDLYSQLPEPTERLWFLWTHLFSCAIVLGSIVTRCPSMSIAPSALLQLDSACEQFEKVADRFRAGKVLIIMQNLREKAHISLREWKEGRQSPQSAHLPYKRSVETTPEAEDGDELFKLGGKTRFISQKESSKSPSPPIVTLSPSSENPILPLPLADHATDVHPSVMEYLSSFNFSPSISRTQHNQALYQAQHGGFTHSRAPNLYNGIGQFDARANEGRILHTPTSGSPSSPEFEGFLPHLPPMSTSSSTSLPHQASATTTPAGSSANVANQFAQPSQPQQHASFLPSYFPVFDYGTPTVGVAGTSSNAHTVSPHVYEQGGMGFDDAVMSPNISTIHQHGHHGVGSFGNSNGFGHDHHHKAFIGTNGLNHGSGHMKHESTSFPSSGTMHLTWEDFVAQMSSTADMHTN